MAVATEEEPGFNYSKHINYWRRNLKTFLPVHYTSNDPNRMMLAFFILSAADILGDLKAALSEEDRKGYIEWVYHCQHPEGGFRPFTGTDFGTLRNDENAVWDPAHIPGTFFGLLVLVLLGDDLKRAKRREILLWLTKMQRPDGSFGEALGEDGRIEGDCDTRFGHMATGIRWILRGNVEGTVEDVPDIDVDKFVQHVRQSETYDGGISEAPFHEAHAGFTACAINALFFIDRLPLRPSQEPDDRLRGVTNLPMTLHWLASRQTLTIEEEEPLHEDETDSSEPDQHSRSFVKVKSYPEEDRERSVNNQPKSHPELEWVGLNGRCNKIGDTCYAYWVCAPLQVLGHLNLVDSKPIRRWLLGRTQHIVGGFGKLPGYLPDIYHSYLGLFSLSLFGQPGLKSVDAALCMSNEAKDHLESLPWRKEIVVPK